jgi:Mn-containing catalase
LRENTGAEQNPEGSPAVPADKPFTHEQHVATT